MSDGRDRDSGRVLHKNGNERRQDNDIRELREHFREMDEKNTEQHSAIGETLMDIKGAIRGATWVHRLIWGFTTLFILGLISMLGWMSSQITSIDARTQADWARGRTWGEALDKDIAELRHELDILEDTVHSFQRSQGHRHLEKKAR